MIQAIIVTILLCFSTFAFGAEKIDINNKLDKTDYAAQFQRDSALSALVYSRSLTYESANTDIYNTLIEYSSGMLPFNRRGLDWWLFNKLYNVTYYRDENTIKRLNPLITSSGKARLYGSSKGYNIGAEAKYAFNFDNKWSLYLALNGRLGRDLSVDGLYSESITPEVYLARHFSNSSTLLIESHLPYSYGSRRSTATAESMQLLNNNLYNPSWGWYDGEQRSSKTTTNAIAYNKATYNKIFKITTLTATLQLNYGHKKYGQLAWYDATNPNPDYYRKLPSYLSSSQSYTTVANEWIVDNQQYTQIAWQRLYDANSLSDNGEAHYVMEQQCQRIAENSAKVLCTTNIAPPSALNHRGASLRYGIEIQHYNNRFYKELDDLLGANHLTDMDYYIGDAATMGNDMANNLNDPFREIYEGDRFGYDYAIKGNVITTIIGAEYYQDRFTLSLDTYFGREKTTRIGYYKKERFAQTSLGSSTTITQQDTKVDYLVGYNISSRNQITLKGSYALIPTYHNDLFIQACNSNTTINTPTPRNVNSIELGYLHNNYNYKFSSKLFFVSQRNSSDIQYYYDDWANIYTNAVISDISTNSMGCEIAFTSQLTQKVTLGITSLLGRYRYTSAPLVTLYNDNDLTRYSQSSASALNGCNIGNAPSLANTLKVTYYIRYGLTVSGYATMTAGNYVEPSIVRRTDRVLLLASSAGLYDDVTSQTKLPTAIDLTMTVNKRVELNHAHHINIYLRLANLLASASTVRYASEGNRIYSSDNSLTDSRYCQPVNYLYDVGRNIYISISYEF